MMHVIICKTEQKYWLPMEFREGAGEQGCHVLEPDGGSQARRTRVSNLRLTFEAK